MPPDAPVQPARPRHRGAIQWGTMQWGAMRRGAMRRARLCLALLAPFCAAPAGAEDIPLPRFRPVDAPHHVYAGGWEHFVGGGLAAFDCDGDTLPELFAAGGANPGQLLRNRSTPGGALRFVADTPPALAETGITGAYPLDLDSDGWQDLVLLRAGENRILKGGPDCRFAAFADLGSDLSGGDRWTTAFAATWEPGQTLPSLAFGNYVDRSDPDGPFRACDDNLLFRPAAGSDPGGGPGYGAPIRLTPGHCALSMLFSDWARQGRADLRISNDRHYYVDDGQEQLWAMGDPPRLYTAEDGWQRHQIWGMGIAQRDLDGDGRAELFLTSMGDQRLQRLTDPARPAYADAPYALGTTAHRPYQGDDGRPSTGWHVAFGDVQNDGRDDIFIAKGNVDQMPGSAMADPNNLLIAGPDGRFTEAGGQAGIASPHRGRGAVLDDLNRDGRLDLAVVNRRAPLEIWQNVTEGTGHWLGLALRQPPPNRDAIGAWVELEAGARRQHREWLVGGGHAGGRAGPEHFGLGRAETARLRVTWPDGTRSGWIETPVNRYLTLIRDGTHTRIAP